MEDLISIDLYVGWPVNVFQQNGRIKLGIAQQRTTTTEKNVRFDKAAQKQCQWKRQEVVI